MRTTKLESEKNHKNFLQLCVVSGSQAGANHDIGENTELTIGNAIENDIVIFSAGHESTKLLLKTHDAEVRIKVLLGSVNVNDEALYVDMHHLVEDGDSFTLGTSKFVLNIRQNPAGSYVSQQEQETTDLHKPLFDGNPFTARPLTFLCLALGMVLLVSGISTGMVSAFSDRSQAPAIQQLISDQDFENLIYQENQNGKIEKITGSVRTRDDMRHLMEMVGLQKEPVHVDVQVDQDLIDSVADIYRVNGIKADVSVVGLGEVRVWTSTSNVNLLHSVESIVKKDLKNIVAVIRENTPPSERLVVEKNSPISINDPDKQITLVVAGDTGYLMTKDKSRYFVGSLLPSGHEITRIEGGAVYVSVDGSEVKLDF